MFQEFAAYEFTTARVSSLPVDRVIGVTFVYKRCDSVTAKNGSRLSVNKRKLGSDLLHPFHLPKYIMQVQIVFLRSHAQKFSSKHFALWTFCVKFPFKQT